MFHLLSHNWVQQLVIDEADVAAQDAVVPYRSQKAECNHETAWKERAPSAYTCQHIVHVEGVVSAFLSFKTVGEAKTVLGNLEPVTAHHTVDNTKLSFADYSLHVTFILTVEHILRICDNKKPALGVLNNQ